ncbi:hypothetical protein BGZ91_010890 [Linnemannia elongata]|nr:hypothetical protein BGZ91_010890 [Linnemannia elongata]KAG0067430.1 hypothetical protein BGZ90_000998 [Linnemannia elongata]
MKIQFISLLLVASVAMSRPVPFSTTTTNVALDRRTLIGDEYAVNNQVDNSRGKKTVRVDHNGDSSIHKGLLYDLIDPSRSGADDTDGDFQFRRRSLLGDLFGGNSMSISNENDNSKHTQTKNEHDNQYTTVNKIHEEQNLNDDEDEEDSMSPDSFFDKRGNGDEHGTASASFDRRGLFGGDSTTINNVNDNSKHTQTMNVHHNRDTSITKLHKHQQSSRPRPRRGDATIPKGFFDRRSDESNDMNRRSLLGDLFGGNSMSINNVNDNSQTKKTLNSHGNRNTHITKIHKTTNSRHRDEDNNSDSNAGFFDKRGLLFGSDEMVINNENDNSQTKKTLNSHGNRHARITRIHKSSSHGSNFFGKRGLLFGDKSTVITNQNDNSQNKKTLNSYHNRNSFDEVTVEKNMRVVEDGF